MLSLPTLLDQAIPIGDRRPNCSRLAPNDCVSMTYQLDLCGIYMLYTVWLTRASNRPVRSPRFYVLLKRRGRRGTACGSAETERGGETVGRTPHMCMLAL